MFIGLKSIHTMQIMRLPMPINICTKKIIRPIAYIVGGMKDLYKKSPTYCSKYVYLAYYRGATKKSVKKFNKNHLVTPHGLPLDFAGTFKPSLIHVIT